MNIAEIGKNGELLRAASQTQGNYSGAFSTNISRLLLDASRPVLRRLPRGAGTFYRLLGGYRKNRAWSRYGARTVRGIDHGYQMRLCLDDSFERETYYLGRFYESELLSVVNSIVEPGDTFIDVGANIGMITLHAAAQVGPQGLVLAFEPNPEARARLVEHVRINDLQNVRIFETALAESSGTATLTMANAHSGTATLRSLNTALRSYAVPVARLDDFFGQIPERRVFLKIDTEGYDFNVLKGAGRLLARPGVTVFAEVNHRWLEELGQSAHQMFAYMSNFGFKAFLPRLEARFLRRRLKLQSLSLPGPHHWFNALFLREENSIGAMQ